MAATWRPCPRVRRRDAPGVARRLRVPRGWRVELVALTGSRLVRLLDGGGDVHVGVVREAELTVLGGDDMLGTLERRELPEASRRSRSSTPRRSTAGALGAAGPGPSAGPGPQHHLRAQPLGSACTRARLSTCMSWCSTRSGPSCSSRTPRDGARSGRARRSPPAAMRRGLCPSPSWPSCWAPAGRWR